MLSCARENERRRNRRKCRANRLKSAAAEAQLRFNESRNFFLRVTRVSKAVRCTSRRPNLWVCCFGDEPPYFTNKLLKGGFVAQENVVGAVEIDK
jgi:hypothetical protein